MSLRIGKIVGSYGVYGQVKIKSFTSPPQTLIHYQSFSVNQIQRSLQRYRFQTHDTVIASLSGIDSREQAIALRGSFLSIERSQLPTLTDPDEFYYADLIGLTCLSPERESLGVVSDVFDFGAGPILEVTDKAASFLVSFTHQAVPLVDLEARRLILSPLDEI